MPFASRCPRRTIPSPSERLRQEQEVEPGMEGPGADAEKAEVEEFEKLTTRVLLNPKDYLVRGVPLPTLFPKS
jgi:hypothetical protein